MSTRIFAEAGYDLTALLLPYDAYRPFFDREGGVALSDTYRQAAIAAGESLLGKTHPLLPLSDYLRFFKNGDRKGFESRFFERRRDLLTLTLAEVYEGKGRFMEEIADLLWMILEESTWVLPAHINPRPSDRVHTVPYAYEGGRNYIDLFAGATGADLAWVWYLLHDRMDDMSPVIGRRVLENLRDRIIVPFTEHTDEMAWMGNGPFRWINNWCPWVISNVLTVCALTVTDDALRRRVVEIALEGLDRFTATYEEDGGCDEGPSYWGAAGGALYNACLVLFDLTGGGINGFTHPLVRKMGEFFPKMYIGGGRFLNFSDASSKLGTPAKWGHDWGVLSGSSLMQSFWEYACPETGALPAVDTSLPYRYFRLLGAAPLTKGDFKASRSEYFPSLQLMVSRNSEHCGEGIYLSLKGGHNAASHNHLDVGNFVVFCDGKPVFVDAGVGSYTAKTFSGLRYTIWSMCSHHHNIPTVNGVDQLPGRRFEATDPLYEADRGMLTLNLTRAYPPEAAISSFVRSAAIENGRAVIRDEITSLRNGEVTFNLLCACEPVPVGDGILTVHGKTVRYDPTLTLSVDSPDCSEPETAGIPGAWDCEKMYRLRLTAPLRQGEACVFQLEVCP